MPTPLRGRDQELALLKEHIDRLTTGAGSVWLVEAGAGIGKSRLLDEVMDAALAAGFAVAHGVGEPADRTVQFAPVLDALLGGPQPLLDRSALGEWQASAEQRYWLLQDLASLLERSALRRPIVICLDDLHWADSGTAAAVRSLPGRLSALPITWVLAYRPAEVDPNLERAFATLLRDGAKCSTLRPLDSDDALQVARDVLDAAPDDAVQRLTADASGNPFLLIELLSGLREEQLIRVQDGQATLVGGGLPRRVRTSMRRRLERMSPLAGTVAAAGASMGRGFTLTDLGAALDTPPAVLLAPVAELVRGDVFSERDGRLGFVHDLIREAVRASQPSSALQALDRQVASALLAAGALPVEVALQLSASAEIGDDVAVATLMQASDTLDRTDPDQAVDLARRALELAPDRHPLRGPLVARIAVLLHAAGRTEEATRFADTALRSTLPPHQQAQVHLAVARLFAVSSDRRADACRRALALPDVPLELRARLLSQLIYNLAVGVHPEEADALLDEGRHAVEESDDGTARFTLQLAESYLNYSLGRYERALTLADTAFSVGTAGEETTQHLARNLRCGLLAATDRIDDALADLTEGIASAHRGRHAWALTTYETRRGCLLAQLGRLADAEAALTGLYSPEGAHLVVAGLEVSGLVTLGRIAVHTGNRPLRDLTAAVATVMLGSGIPKVEHHAAWLLAWQAMADGDTDQVRHYLRAGGHEQRRTLFPPVPHDPGDDPHLVRMALALQDDELAESAAAAAQRRHELSPAVLTLRAGAAHTQGLLTRDRDLLAQAVTVLQGGQRRLALASALEDLAGAEAGQGNSDAAIAALDLALATYTACGAGWDAARTRRRLRRLGVRRRVPASTRPAHGWQAMTGAQLDVVRLVAGGLTNKEVAEQLCISPHTVNGHLRQAFDKLGVNSRVALTRIAVQHLS